MGAADYAGDGWGGALLVRESVVQRTASGLRHLATGQARHRTMSRLEKHNRELWRREKLGTVWTEHNLLALLQEQGLITKPPKTKRYRAPLPDCLLLRRTVLIALT